MGPAFAKIDLHCAHLHNAVGIVSSVATSVMQFPNSHSPSGANSQTRELTGAPSPVSSLLELLTTSAPRPTHHATDASSPPYILRFLRECDGKLVASTATELGVIPSNGDWLPFELSLMKRLSPLRLEISKTILTSLSSVSSDSAQSSLFHGGYQIHLDTMCCFWLGHPETKSNLEELVGKIVASAPPFKEPRLNTIAAHTMLDCIAVGTLDLPHFVYHHLSPDFVTISCHPSVKQEASRHLSSQDRKRSAR